MDLVFGCLVAHNRFPLVAPTNQYIATNGVTLTGELNRRLLRYRLIYFATSFNLTAWMPRDLYLLIVWNAITVGVIGPYGIKRHIVPDQELRSGLYQMILDCVGLSLGCNPRRIGGLEGPTDKHRARKCQVALILYSHHRTVLVTIRICRNGSRSTICVIGHALLQVVGHIVALSVRTRLVLTPYGEEVCECG